MKIEKNNHISLTEEAQVAKREQLGSLSPKTWTFKPAPPHRAAPGRKNMHSAKRKKQNKTKHDPSRVSSLRVCDHLDHLNKREGPRLSGKKCQSSCIQPPILHKQKVKPRKAGDLTTRAEQTAEVPPLTLCLFTRGLN